MKRGFKLRDCPITKLQNSQRGYILITLMLFLALIAIAALAILPDVVQQARRDREEEMINRALQYSRAIRRYYKKFGRYPTRVEELENTNQIRFLRKRYKDPITGKDFKIIRMGDPILAAQGFTGGIGLAVGAGVGQNPAQGFVAAQGGGIRPAGPGDMNTPQVTGLPQPASGGNGDSSGNDSGDNQSGGTGNSGTSGSAGSSGPGSATGPSGSSGTSKSPFSGQTFGGGPMLGVVSASKATSIREFNKKTHYNEWLFIYDPTSDRGGLLTTPYQQNTNLNSNAPQGQPGGVSGQPQSNFGPQVGPQPGGPPNPANQMPPDQ